jgi:hypothetical protein
VVDQKDGTTPLAWTIKADGDTMFTSVLGSEAIQQSGGMGSATHQIATAPPSNIVRFSTNNDMSTMLPYGESVLAPVLRAFKQKQLIEDAIVIYRVQRAPERRAFYIDVGNAPLPIRAQLLDQIKNEIKQKKVPRAGVGGDPTENSGYDKVLDPMETNADYFFPVSQDARGSRVEVLPGGANVGEVSDLSEWRRSVWRALKIPVSYIEDGSESQGVYNDGKTGVAYIQELKFNMMVQRLQQHLNVVFDREFKRYLKENDIIVDNDKFNIRLPVPQNFASYRQQMLDADLLQNFSSADNIGYLSKRYVLGRFMMMSQQDILDNERQLREELGLDPDDNTIPSHFLYNEEFRGQLAQQFMKRVAMASDTLDDALDSETGEAFGDTSMDDFGDDMGGGADFGGGSDFGAMGGDVGYDFDSDTPPEPAVDDVGPTPNENPAP